MRAGHTRKPVQPTALCIFTEVKRSQFKSVRPFVHVLISFSSRSDTCPDQILFQQKRTWPKVSRSPAVGLIWTCFRVFRQNLIKTNKIGAILWVFWRGDCPGSSIRAEKQCFGAYRLKLPAFSLVLLNLSATLQAKSQPRTAVCSSRHRPVQASLTCSWIKKVSWWGFQSSWEEFGRKYKNFIHKNKAFSFLLRL